MHDVVSRFSVLFPVNFINKEKNIIIQETSSLKSKYPDDISPEFPIQLLSYCAAMESEIKKTTTVTQVADLACQRRPPPRGNDAFPPCFTFPRFPKKISDSAENFPDLTFSQKLFRFSSAKISDDLFLVIDYFGKFFFVTVASA